MKRVCFEVLEHAGPAPRFGYVAGEFGTHRERYSWVFTHLPTGLKINAAWCETKAAALTELKRLQREGLPERVQEVLRGVPLLRGCQL